MHRIGVIGCGGRIRNILKKMFAVGGEFEVCAICDCDKTAIEKTQQLLPENAKVYEEYNKLAAADDIDWVFVGSWNCFYKDHAIAALENGKNIYCEKPLATTVEDCKQINSAVENAGVMFVMGFTLRFSPHYRKIKDIVDSGAIGEIISMELNETLEFNHGGHIHSAWRRLKKNSGPYLLEKCCHDIDIINWVIGDVPKRAASFAGNNFFIPKNSYHIARLGKNRQGVEAYKYPSELNPKNPFTCDKDISDNQVVILEFDSGQRVCFHTNCNSALPERRLYICGSEGALRADVISGRIEYKRIGWETEAIVCSTGVSGGHGGGDEVLAGELVRAVLYNEKPSASFREGLNSAMVCFAAEKSVQEQKVIDIEAIAS